MSSLGKKATTLAHSAHPFQDFRHRQQLERTQQPLQEKDGGLYWYWPSGNIDIHYHRLVDRKPHFRDKKALEREHNRSRIKFAIYQKTVSSPGWTDQKKKPVLYSLLRLGKPTGYHPSLTAASENNIDNRKQNSAVLASFFLHEKLGTVGKVGCALCLIGSVVIVLHSPEEKNIESVDEILTYAMQPGMLCSLS